jgi:general secretion pathway protein D
MRYILASFLCFAPVSIFSQTIAEKIASGTKSPENAGNFEIMLREINQQLAALRSELTSCYRQAGELYAKGSSAEEEFKTVLHQVNFVKEQIHSLEMRWRDAAIGEAKRDEEGYALWDQEETTLAQLVMEYGALDYLFIVPPEMAALKLNMHSNIPIPRESWSEMLEIILSHNGIGVKKINNYVRQLYILKQDPSAIQAMASSPLQLQWIPDHTRLFYVFNPPVEQVRSSFQFFEKFADAKQTFIYQIGPKIAIVANKEEVVKLLDLYHTVWENAQGKISRVITINKMAAKEMEKILQSFFGEAMEKNRPPFGKPEQEGLNMFSLVQGNALILIGQEEVVCRAEKIIKDTEEQLHDPAEMTVYLYSCRHSNPEDLAKVLEKVYNSLLFSSSEANKETEFNLATQGPQFKTPPDGFPPTPPLVVAPPPLKIGSSASLDVEQGSDHFIADPKTGNLLMVVRRDALAKIKDLLRKLDVPKKMVQIEVMLFEKRIKNENSYGMNMLKLGSKKNGIQFTSQFAPTGRGVLEYLLHGKQSKHFPAYDLALNFLMSQEDVQLNAAPSTITVNQTPATISIVEEISINNGAAPVDTSKGTIAFEKSFSRAQFGITIIVTPTVHLPDLDDELCDGKGFVTMQTNVTFDTTKHHNQDDRPLVDRRHIENEVRVLDGQTVILGGLRRKSSQDNEDKIPFIGDIPGLGKLFGSTKLTNNNTEMFIFITPTIILDPEEQLIAVRNEEVKKRPGDIPEYLQRVVEAQEKERKKYFRNSFKALFGNSNV